MISHLLEALMILCFGLSWPLSIYKSWTSRTAKGKSLYFEVFIWIGYIFGIANKFISYMRTTRTKTGSFSLHGLSIS